MNPNPAAASSNLHHTRSYWSEQEEYEDFQRSQAEAEYFAHVDSITHNYPLSTTSDILVDNGVTTIHGEVPF